MQNRFGRKLDNMDECLVSRLSNSILEVKPSGKTTVFRVYAHIVLWQINQPAPHHQVLHHFSTVLSPTEEAAKLEKNHDRCLRAELSVNATAAQHHYKHAIRSKKLKTELYKMRCMSMFMLFHQMVSGVHVQSAFFADLKHPKVQCTKTLGIEPITLIERQPASPNEPLPLL